MGLEIGINGVNKAITKVEFGINNVWKEVNKAEIGINGAWKEGYTSGKDIFNPSINLIPSLSLSDTGKDDGVYSDSKGSFEYLVDESCLQGMIRNTSDVSDCYDYADCYIKFTKLVGYTKLKMDYRLSTVSPPNGGITGYANISSGTDINNTKNAVDIYNTTRTITSFPIDNEINCIKITLTATTGHYPAFSTGRGETTINIYKIWLEK